MSPNISILSWEVKIDWEGNFVVTGYKVHNCITFRVYWTKWSGKNSALSAYLLKPKDAFIRNETSVLLISNYPDMWSDDDRTK